MPIGREVISDCRLPIADCSVMSTELILNLRFPTAGLKNIDSSWKLNDSAGKPHTAQSEIGNWKSAMVWWRRRELNSDPRVNAEKLYMLSPFSSLSETNQTKIRST